MNDSELDHLLKTCDSPALPHTGFKRDVWSRIEAAESTRPIPHFTHLLDRFLGFFALPPVAVATCGVMIAAGIWTGLATAPQNASTEVAYIHSISPFNLSRH